MSFAICFNLDQSKILSSGNGLNLYKTTVFWTKPVQSKLDVAETIELVLDRIENCVGKGENAGNRYFLLSPQGFQRASFSGSLTCYAIDTHFDASTTGSF